MNRVQLQGYLNANLKKIKTTRATQGNQKQQTVPSSSTIWCQTSCLHERGAGRRSRFLRTTSSKPILRFHELLLLKFKILFWDFAKYLFLNPVGSSWSFDCRVKCNLKCAYPLSNCSTWYQNINGGYLCILWVRVWVPSGVEWLNMTVYINWHILDPLHTPSKCLFTKIQFWVMALNIRQPSLIWEV